VDQNGQTNASHRKIRLGWEESQQWLQVETHFFIISPHQASLSLWFHPQNAHHLIGCCRYTTKGATSRKGAKVSIVQTGQKTDIVSSCTG
jgi:hypothetical protein